MTKRIASTILLLLALIAVAHAIGTTEDITGTGARVQLASTGTARWVQVIADPANSAAVRVGDYAVTSTRGVRIAAGGGFMLPPQGQAYNLENIYFYIANGDKVSVSWGN